MTNMNTFQSRFIELLGQLAEMCSFNRSIGQIYGSLYMSPEPLCLEEIARICRMSKGNASIHLRTLESWGAVHPTGKPGSRKDYYSANSDLRNLAIKRLQDGFARRLEHTHQVIKTIKEDPEFPQYLEQSDGAHCNRRLDELESLIQQIQSSLLLLPKLFELKRLLPL